MAALSNVYWEVVPFGFEERLQDMVASTPRILASPNWSGPRLLLGREIPTRGQLEIQDGPTSERTAQGKRGWMDLCFIEADGMPTIVEAKLAGNTTMKEVLGQALGYADTLFANPSRAAMTMRSALGSLAKRSPMSLGVFRLVGETFPAWTPDTVREQIQKHLEERRCRVVVVADGVPRDVVWEASRRRPALDRVSLDLVNVRRTATGKPHSQRIDVEPAAYERAYAPPAVGKPQWELVERERVEAKVFMRQMVDDRIYYQHKEYRIKRTGSLPAVLYYEAAPGRAPVGHLHQIERSRRESCAPVMPNLDLLMSPARNPYPCDGWSKTVLTDPKYRQLVAVCHATWEYLRRHDPLDLRIDDAKSVQHDIVRSANVTLDSLSSEVRWVALTAPFDAMRDCSLYGLVRHSRRGHTEHRFERNTLPDDFARVRW